MKRSNFLLLLLISSWAIGGCKKDSRTDPEPELPNTAPVITDVRDKFLELPDNGFVVSASAEDAENNIMTYQWTKISGPDSFFFENSTYRNPHLRNLVKGAYIFELKVTDLGGLYDTARMKVIVGELPTVTREIMIDKLAWDCWEYECFVRFNPSNYIPAGSFFKPYILQQDTKEWIPATLKDTVNCFGDNLVYRYSLNDNEDCWITHCDPVGTWDSLQIKIVY